MRFMETSLMVYDYPEPTEIEERAVSVNITISYTLDFDVPRNWSDSDIEHYVVDNLDCLQLYDEKIENIEIN